MQDFSKMKFSPEMVKKIEACATPEELVQVAKENNVDLTLEDAQQALTSLDKELTDDELEKVSGGVDWCPSYCGSKAPCYTM